MYSREDQINTRNTPIGDKYLVSIEDIIISLSSGRGLQGGSIRARIGFSEAECPYFLTRGQRHQKILMLVLAPKFVGGIGRNTIVHGNTESHGRIDP